MDRLLFVGIRVWMAVLFLLAPVIARAGGLSFVEYEQATSLGTNGLRGARDVAVHNQNVYVVGESADAILVWVHDSVTNVLTFLDFEEDGEAGVDGMKSPQAVAATSDGSCVYVATLDNPPGPGDAGAVVVFGRAFSGNLTFVEVQQEGLAGVDGIGNAAAITTSLDAKHVYVVGARDDAIGIFSRTAPSCALTFVGFVQDGVGGVVGLDNPTSVIVSYDGNHVYAAGRTSIDGVAKGTIVAFDRNTTTGALTYLEHEADGVAGVNGLQVPVTDLTVGGGFGQNIYATSLNGDAVVAFTRDLGTGLLTFLETERPSGLAQGFKGASGISMGGADDYVYVTGREDNALAVFKRDLTSGTLDFLEFHDDPVPGTNVLGSAEAVAVSDDLGGGVFVASSGPDTLSAFIADRCGNGTTGVDEQCDDGCLAGVANACEPVDDGDGCSSTCRIELCTPTPTGACHAATPLGGASFQIKNQSEDRKDQLKWSWKGQTTPLAQFGDPVTTANYVLCVYDGSGNPQPLMSRAAPAGGTCNGKPCWTAKPTSLQYGDKFLTPNGVKKILLREGLVDGKPKVQVQGAGIFIDPPALPLTLPVTVQVKNTQNSECWQAVYSVADKNEAAQFKAKSD